MNSAEHLSDLLKRLAPFIYDYGYSLHTLLSELCTQKQFPHFPYLGNVYMLTLHTWYHSLKGFQSAIIDLHGDQASLANRSLYSVIKTFELFKCELEALFRLPGSISSETITAYADLKERYNRWAEEYEECSADLGLSVSLQRFHDIGAVQAKAEPAQPTFVAVCTGGVSQKVPR